MCEIQIKAIHEIFISLAAWRHKNNSNISEDFFIAIVRPILK